MLKKNITNGFRDYYETFLRPITWIYLGYMDITMKYKRTLLGPWWNTLGICLIVGVLSTVWPLILSADFNFFIPYFSIGFVLWNWFSMTITESASSLVESENLVKQINIPLTTHLLRISIRNFISFIHNSVLLFFVVFYFNIEINFFDIIFKTLPGVFLIFFSLNSIGIILSIISLRFRDFINIIFFILQILFFFTPVLWHPSILNKGASMIELNLLFYWIDILRQPLLGLEIHQNSLLIIFLTSILFFVISLIFIGKYKNKIYYWL